LPCPPLLRFPNQITALFFHGRRTSIKDAKSTKILSFALFALQMQIKIAIAQNSPGANAVPPQGEGLFSSLSPRERVGVREVQGVRKALKIRKLKEDFPSPCPLPEGEGKNHYSREDTKR
jgi:hypothetical protein